MNYTAKLKLPFLFAPGSMHQYSPVKSIGSKSESQLHSSIVQPHSINSPSGKDGKPLSQDAKIQSNGTTRKMSNTNVVLAPWEIETFSQDSGYHDNEKGTRKKDNLNLFK